MTTSSQPGGLAVSVVSHGHGPLLHAMLHGMARWCAGSVTRVVLTLNIPEPAPPLPPGQMDWPFTLDIRSNARPQGFGANHNAALDGATEAFVGVLNPDIAFLGTDPFERLLRSASEQGVGCAYPEQVDGSGKVQDSERELPTPGALWRRRILHRPDRRTDWVNAAFLVFPAAAWKAVGGVRRALFHVLRGRGSLPAPAPDGLEAGQGAGARGPCRPARQPAPAGPSGLACPEPVEAMDVTCVSPGATFVAGGYRSSA